MNSKKNSMQFYKLPLVAAIGSVLLVGCSTNSVNNTTQTSPVIRNEQVNKPVINTGYSTALLDEESLDELENLLEATDMTMVEDDKLAIQQVGNLWDRLRAGFRMDHAQYQNNQRVEAQKNWFITRQDYINRLTARASRYLYHTVREAERRNIPTELALLPIIESSYDPTGTSNAAAAGLWQFIPSTGRIYGLNQTRSYDGRRDVVESTRAAYDFLTTLYNQFGSWELALAAYNAGPGRVQKAIDANISRGLPTDFWSLNLPTETMHYVPRFMAVAEIVKNTDRYGIYLPAIANRQHFRSVPVNYGVSLQEVAQVTGVTIDELRLLNPALTNLIVDSAGPNRVIIPNQINIQVDSKLSHLGSGTSATYTASSSISDAEFEEMSRTSSGLAQFAAIAKAPKQNTSYITPSVSTNASGVEPALTASEKQFIESELKASNTLPTTSAQVTANATIVQEPPLSATEKEFISAQIRSQTPEVKEVVSAVDGNVKLEAIQTQQSILAASGQEKRISFGTEESQRSANRPTGKRSIYTVQSGDTLSNIAERAGVNWRDIASWNQIDPNATLLSGTKLYLYNAKPIQPLSQNNTQHNSPQSVLTSERRNSQQQQSYTVASGDTLTGVASKHGLTTSQLASYNNLDTNAMLTIGQKLWLVPGKVSPTKSNASLPQSNNASSVATTQLVDNYKGSRQSYTVKQGDTLYGLATRHKVSVATLAAMNNLATNAQLLTGQHITVPAVEVQHQVSTPAASTRKASYNGATTNYTVKAGETLSGIATKIGVSHVLVAELNNIAANSQLQRGQVIKLPATKSKVLLLLDNESVRYKVQSGDTLSGVAEKFNVSISEIASANNISESSHLIAGNTIIIPGADASASNNQSARASASRSTNISSRSATYTVRSGDTLSGIANKHDVAISTLAAANNISSNAQVQIGQRLNIPANNTTSSSARSANRNSATYNDTYKVQSGDTLSGIANKFGISLSDLASANDLASNSQLQIGQTLKVPSTSSSNSHLSSRTSTSSNNTSGNYTVRSGDTLIGLANKNGLSVKQLAAANNLSTNAQLQIGQQINIPATTTSYRVKSGDSLNAIARRSGLTVQELAELNNLDSDAMLQIGQILKVPVQ